MWRKADRVEETVEMHGSDWGTGKKSESFSTLKIEHSSLFDSTTYSRRHHPYDGRSVICTIPSRVLQLGCTDGPSLPPLVLLHCSLASSAQSILKTPVNHS